MTQAPKDAATDPQQTIADLQSRLSESLARETATAEVMRLINGSPGDLAPVFDAILEKAHSLCGVTSGALELFEGDLVRTVASRGLNERWEAWLRAGYKLTDLARRIYHTAHHQHIPDLGKLVERFPDEPNLRAVYEIGGFRTFLALPLVKDGLSFGRIVAARSTILPFTDRQIALLQSFAEQAVIAIENVRLFDEVEARTRDLTEALTYQTGSANILRVIASSPTDVGPVLQAIVESACELCDAKDAVLLLRDGDDLRFSAHHGPLEFNSEKLPINRTYTAGRAFLDREPVHVRDVLSDGGAEFPGTRERAQHLGLRSVLSVPLLRDNESIGTIMLRRTEVHPFSDKQIALLQTFADQAVIAIGNVRLFEEVQAKTRELSQSLDDLRTAQDRLVQTEKLASLGQLTAGIAHEIKNPLNFVNNFSALSAELVDELDETLAPAPLDQKMRGDVGELTQMLKSNLEKVVQHGKRADSIVKNMLLHSRAGSGEQRPADINALLDESLNLAYHGARAETPGFNITLQRDLDPNAGAIDVFPQEITRAFINLISNGFYAASKHKAENGDPDFEPLLSVATKDLGSQVEIRIRDNGTGIPSEVKEKIFNPFFTTKPAGEGTGLGLSMSHDIIVKQHGGRIEVETEPGQFTEFTIVLPRTSDPANKGKNRGQL
jgi:two-component system, NtrC family, sensor kinase